MNIVLSIYSSTYPYFFVTTKLIVNSLKMEAWKIEKREIYLAARTANCCNTATVG